MAITEERGGVEGFILTISDAFYAGIPMPTNEDKIRQRAYELWEQSGKEGSEMDYWLRAEKELAERESAATPPQDRLE